ncbi:MAG: replicative DNA helicase, partial [Ruminococcus sp.]|nr:replicative DNA helicase [Ruminococcus sp.]
MAENNTYAEYNPTNLPYSAEAEQAVLGAIIIDNAMFDNVLDYIKTADYFYVS